MDQASGRINKLSSLQAAIVAEHRGSRLRRRLLWLVSLIRYERLFHLLINLSTTLLLGLLIYFLLSLFSFQSNYEALISTGGALLIFVALHPWLELKLERALRPERFIYRQLVEEYGHVVQIGRAHV